MLTAKSITELSCVDQLQNWAPSMAQSFVYSVSTCNCFHTSTHNSCESVATSGNVQDDDDGYKGFASL